MENFVSAPIRPAAAYDRVLPDRRTSPFIVGAGHPLSGMDANTLIANTALDADQRVIASLAEAGKTALVPSKANRKVARDHDRDLYKAGHLIETFAAS